MAPGLWALTLAGFIFGLSLAKSFGFNFLTFETSLPNPAGFCHVWIGPHFLVLLCVLSEQYQVLKYPFWRSNSRAQGLKHAELDSNKPLQQLRVLLKFTERVLPHHSWGSPWWFRLPMVSLYTLWLTTWTVLWREEQVLSLIIHYRLIKIKGCTHTHVCGFIAAEWWERKHDT